MRLFRALAARTSLQRALGRALRQSTAQGQRALGLLVGAQQDLRMSLNDVEQEVDRLQHLVLGISG